MKTLYLKTTMKVLRLLTALIFFMLALSYNARSQYASPNPVCYGQPINLFCGGLFGCGATNATYTWTNLSGTWIFTGVGDPFIDAVINVGDPGYAQDRFYLSIRYAPPVGSFSAGSVYVSLLPEVFVTGTPTNLLCFGAATGTINITATGGRTPYHYQWSNGSTVRNQTGLTAGTYTVTVTDNVGCFKEGSWTVSGPTEISLLASTIHASCFGTPTGSIDLTVGGGTPGYGFAWSNGANTEDIGGLTAGTYTVTVTDLNLCTKTGSFVVNQPPAITLDGTPTQVFCNGGSNGTIDITVGGGTPGFTYAWSNGAATEDISNLPIGFYTVTVTDLNLCTKTGSWEVTQIASMTLSGTPTPVSCFEGNNGSVNITPGGGTLPYSFNWSNGAITEDISALTAGFYAVTVTDANGCTAMDSWQVTQPYGLTIEGSATPALCNGGSTGSVSIWVGGGTSGYSFVWSNTATTQDLVNVPAGFYTVTVTDANLCTITGSWEVTQPSALSLNGTASPVLCNGDPTGSININVGGGTPGYSFAWSNGTALEDPLGLTAGTYTVTVTDYNLCTITGSWEVTQPPALSVSATTVEPLCNGGLGSIDLTVAGGTALYTYLWSNGATSEDLNGITAGTYSVVVTDANDCTGGLTVTLGQPQLIIIEGTVQDVLCNGIPTGAIDITATGGTGALTYSWSNGAVTEDISGLSSGTYTVTVKDANLCEMTRSFFVDQPGALAANGVVTDVRCEGEPNGNIDLSPTGGTMPYGFEWNTGDITEDLTGIVAGTYTVTITDANNCVLSESYVVNEPPNLSWDGHITYVSCFGGNDGSVDGTTFGGTPPYTYLWSNGATTEDLSGLTSGTYRITVTDSHGCIAFTDNFVGQPEELLISEPATITNILCNGGNNGAIDITITGGTLDYIFSWSNGATSEDIGGLTAGTYAVTVTDANGCTTTGQWEVTEPLVLAVSGTPSAVLCNGGSSGSIDITVTGGTLNYTYAWSNGSAAEDPNGLTAGTYTVTVTDANLCTATGSWTVTEPSALSLTGTPTPVLCNGGNTGSINITVTGGTPLYTYAWNNGANSEDISGLTAGTYTVTVTDANNCTITGSWEVTQPPALSLTGTPSPVLCNGGSTGSIDIDVSGGTIDYSYAWSNGLSSEDLNGLTAGFYTVTVTDANGCEITGSWEVTEPGAIIIEGTVQDLLCNGIPTGAIDITATGGTGTLSYTWSNGALTEDISGLSAGTYTVTVTDANMCEQTASFVVGQPDALAANGVVIDVRCEGEPNGAIDLTTTGGTMPYGFEWSTGDITEDITGVVAGTYTVTITDAHSCVLTESWTVNEPPNLSWDGHITYVSCFGGNDGAIDGTTYGGTPPYTYLWSNGATTEDLSGLTSDTYRITITDAHGCLAFTDNFVGQPEPLVISQLVNITNVSCNGGNNGAIDITVAGGTLDYGFSWSNSATTEDIDGLTAGVYSVTVTDAHGCITTGQWEVTEPSALSVTGTPSAVLCNGGNSGSIDITVSGGTLNYNYAWSNGASSEDVNGLTAGTYTVTVTDAYLCTVTGSWTVTEPSALSLTGIPTPVLCNGGRTGSINITVTGGTPLYTYAWNNGANSEDISGLTAGTYTVTVTDANNCTITGSWEVTQPPALSLTGTPSPVLCNGGSTGSIDIDVSGGTIDYSYAWSNGLSSEDLNGLTAGFYTVTVTDANGCEITGSWEVTEPGAISIGGTVQDVLCNGIPTGSIDITATGGTGAFTYMWSNGAGTEDVSALSAGTYTVTVTDANMCEQTASFIVNQPDALAANGVITDVRCEGEPNGSIDLTPTGGTMPYGFEWSTGDITEDITGVVAGTYTVTITDAHSCVLTESWTVTEPPNLSWDGHITYVSCFGGNDGSIDGTTYGGTPPYTYLWSNGATTEDLSGLTADTYRITITDAHGCLAFTDNFVGQPEELVISEVVEITNVSCNGGNNGAIDITVTGGTLDYSFSWSNGATSEDISGLTAGIYAVTVTDAHGCFATGDWEVTEPTALSLTGTSTSVLCNGGNSGSIDITVTGGTLDYIYSWSNGETSEDITNLTAGTYTVTVTDAHACIITGSWTVTEPSALSLTGIPTPVLCNGGNTGSINITVTGGTPLYTYAWNNGANSEDISGLTAGTYTVTVTDANNCTITGSWEVTQPPALSLTGIPSPAECHGEASGSIDITVSGGTLDYSYAWSNGLSSEDIGDLTAGFYTVTVTDANNCVITGSWEVTEPPALSILSTVTPIYCNGANQGVISIEVIGGTPPYSYEWSNSSTLNSPYNCCLYAGCYTVTVTDDNGCQLTESWCIDEPSALSVTGIPTPVVCNGEANGSIDITVSGGTPDYWGFTWSNGDVTEDISGLTAGVYTVTVYDAGGCHVTGSWEVTQPPALSITGTPTNVSCNGGNDGAVDITVTGGTTDYSYAWSNGFTSEDIGGLTAGFYTVTVTDAHQCTITGSWEVTQPPALSLEAAITSVTCYGYSTGSIDLTVTGGTPGYGYAWSNGATTQDISGLPGGWYYVTVTDSHSCTAMASYFVDQPPMWEVNISGPTPVCCNSNVDATYTATVNGVPQNCPVTYEWVVIGGTITSGWNTNHITVHWLCCGQGTVTVTATRCDGCMVSDTYTVTVNEPPAPVIVGPASVLSGTSETYCVEPLIPGHLYTWTVIGGTYTTLPGGNCITVTWGPYPVCGCGQVTVCETDPITGCTGCYTLHITMLPNPDDISISGTVSYKNVLPIPQIPLNGVTVKLRDALTNALVASTVTGPNMNPPYTGEPGYYAFTDVLPGSYKLESSFDGAWGGNNATDALLVQLEFLNPGTVLYGLYHTVADVNASNTVTPLDALYIKLRTVGSINSYPAGDWKFETPSIAFTGVPVVVDYAGLCVGDVNGSYIYTGLKEASFLSVVDDETQIVPVEETFAYEIRSNMVAQLGAMTLFMGYDKDRFEVMDVTTSSNDEMKYVIEDGNVAIAWADSKPMSVRANDQLLTLTVKAKAPIAEATQVFNVKTGSEFASPTGSRYDNFDLKMSKIITAGSSKEFSVFNYPNPFAGNTKIVYTLPESGKVTLVITDMFGKTIRTLVDEFQNAGMYSIPVNAVELNLSQGVYLYRIEAAGAMDNYVKVNKMIFAK